MFIREFNPTPRTPQLLSEIRKSKKYKKIIFFLHVHNLTLLEQLARENYIHKLFQIFRLIRLNIDQSGDESLLTFEE